MAETTIVLRVIMPSAGDMKLGKQDDGIINLDPIFYGNECMGPHIQVVEIGSDGEETVLSRQKLKLKRDGKLELKRAQVAE